MRSAIFMGASLIQDAILYPIKTREIYSEGVEAIFVGLFFVFLIMDITALIIKK